MKNLNRKKAALNPADLPEDSTAFRTMQERTEIQCGALVGVWKQKVEHRGEPARHISELVGSPIDWKNRAETSEYCTHAVDVRCWEPWPAWSGAYHLDACVSS